METRVKRIRVKSLSDLASNVQTNLKPLRFWTEAECMAYVPKSTQLLVLDNTDKKMYKDVELTRSNDYTHGRIFMTKREVDLRNMYCDALGIDTLTECHSAKIDGDYLFLNICKQGKERVIRFNLSYSDKKQSKDELCLDFKVMPKKERPLSRMYRLQSAIDKTVEMISNNLCTLKENSFTNPVFFKNAEQFI